MAYHESRRRSLLQSNTETSNLSRNSFVSADFKMGLMVLLLCIIAFLIQPVASKGSLSIHFSHYTNPGGLGANGHCCDGRGLLCFSACDHYFMLCADRANGNPSSFLNCPYGRRVTTHIRDQDSVMFGSTVGNVPNPMVFDFTYWPRDGFLMKVEVWDSDSGVTTGEYVDSLSKVIDITPAPSAAHARARTVVLAKRTSLTVEIKLFCHENYYGSQCATYCKGQNTMDGHYSCNDVGEKVCLPGWAGERCTIAVNECASSPCQHGGTCEDHHNKFQCNCVPGTGGLFCEINLDDCISQPCWNGGTCLDGIGDYTCNCTYGWEGRNCDVPIDPCLSSPCHNNATCTKIDAYSYNCSCSDGYDGDRCHIDLTTPQTLSTVPPRLESLGVPLLLTGHLDQNDDRTIKRWLDKQVIKSIPISKYDFESTVVISHCTGDDKTDVTNAFLTVNYIVANITDDQVKESMELVTKDIEIDFPYKFFQGKDCMISKVAARINEEPWLQSNWYVPAAIVIIIAVIFVLILVTIFWRRRKGKEQYTDGAVSYECIGNTGSPPTTPIRATPYCVEDDVTQAFSNNLYVQCGGQLPEMTEEEEQRLGQQYSQKQIDDEEEENVYHSID